MTPCTYPIKNDFFMQQNCATTTYYTRVPEKNNKDHPLTAIQAIHVHSRAETYRQCPALAKKELGGNFQSSWPYKPAIANGIIAGGVTVAIGAFVLASLIMTHFTIPLSSIFIMIPLIIGVIALLAIILSTILKYIAYQSTQNAQKKHILAIVRKADTLLPERLLPLKDISEPIIPYTAQTSLQKNTFISVAIPANHEDSCQVSQDTTTDPSLSTGQ